MALVDSERLSMQCRRVGGPQRTSTLSAVPAATYSYDANDRIGGDTFDNNGNTISSAGISYAYDFENRLTLRGAVTIVYDGDGNRVSETVGGTTTKYLVGDRNPTGYSQVLDEIVNGSVSLTYTYGRQLISENQLINGTWTPSFYGYDGHGNVRFLANSSGAITDTYTFDAFGMPIASTGTTANPYLYSGERFDSSLNLYHLRARYYNMLTGRFMTMDPVDVGQTCCALAFSQAKNIVDPGTLHKYVYAQNNPVNRVDPSGKADIEENAFIRLSIETSEKLRIRHQVAYAECVLAAIEGLSILYATEYPNWEAEMLFEEELATAKAHCAELLAGWPGW